MRGGDEREVEHDGPGLHGVARPDGAGDFLEVGGAEVDEHEIDASTGELQGDGAADAGRRAGDHCHAP